MRRLGLLTAVILLTTTALAAGLRQGDLIEMTVLDSFFVHALERYVAGDADHDGRTEVYVRGRDSSNTHWEAQVIEYAGGNRFEIQSLGYDNAIFWACGDGDRDGLSDLLTQGLMTIVFESPDSASLPRDTAWWVLSGPDGFRWPTYTDLDCDSMREIVLTAYSGDHRVVIFENRGDNRYDSVASLPTVPGGVGVQMETVQTHDLDRDGRPELLAGTALGSAVFYESTGNDTYALKAYRLIPESNNSVVGATDDIDRDGRPEGWTLGKTWSGGAILTMFEAVRDDSFEVSWSYGWADGGGPAASSFAGSICAGDIDGDGRDELLAAKGAILLFRCVGDDSFELVWRESGTSRAALIDINRDGRDELFHMRGFHWTLIREYLGPGIAEQEWVEVEERPGPTVLRASDLARYEGRMLDVQGREVRSATSDFGVLPYGQAAHRTSHLPPGVYFLLPNCERRTPNAELGTRKVIVTR